MPARLSGSPAGQRDQRRRALFDVRICPKFPTAVRQRELLAGESRDEAAAALYHRGLSSEAINAKEIAAMVGSHGAFAFKQPPEDDARSARAMCAPTCRCFILVCRMFTRAVRERPAAGFRHCRILPCGRRRCPLPTGFRSFERDEQCAQAGDSCRKLTRPSATSSESASRTWVRIDRCRRRLVEERGAVLTNESATLCAAAEGSTRRPWARAMPKARRPLRASRVIGVVGARRHPALASACGISK